MNLAFTLVETLDDEDLLVPAVLADLHHRTVFWRVQPPHNPQLLLPPLEEQISHAVFL